jgi:hypothetical protein
VVTALGIAYLVVGTLSFFLWAYGVVSFIVDVRRKLIPAVQSWLRSDEASTDGPDVTWEGDAQPVAGADVDSENGDGAGPTPEPGSGSEAIIRPDATATADGTESDESEPPRGSTVDEEG